MGKVTCAVYRARHESGRLTYVGVTVNIPRRIREHRMVESWWLPNVDYLDVEWYASRLEAMEVERRALRDEAPRHNKLKSEWSSPFIYGPLDLLHAERIDIDKTPTRAEILRAYRYRAAGVSRPTVDKWLGEK